MPIEVQVLLRTTETEIVAYVPAIDFSVTYGATREEALERTQEMILGYMVVTKMKSLPKAFFDLEILDLLLAEGLHDKPSSKFESVMLTVTPDHELPTEPIASTSLPDLQPPTGDTTDDRPRTD